ncbi:MAG: type II secretion system F family protein [Tepidisphaeraceae bacterium]
MFKVILETLFWCIAAGAVMLGAAVVVGFIFNPILGYVAAVVVIGLLPLSLRMASLVRRRRASTLLTYLDQAVRLNLPLPRMLEAAMASETGVIALRLLHLRTLLSEGAPVGLALDSAVPEMPRREVSIISAAERIGRLPHGIDRVLRERTLEQSRSAMDDQVFYRAYPLVMVVMLSTVIGMVAVFVLPKYEQIFKDFGIKFPAITIYVFAAARDIGPVLVFAAVVIVLYASAASLGQVFFPGRARRMLVGKVRDRLFWSLPILHGIERDRGLADAFDLLADAFAVGMPANAALIEASGLGVNVVLRNRLKRWAEATASGQSLGDGARAAVMPPLVVGMLANVSITAAAADVFGFLARYYRTRFSRTAALLNGAAVPLVTCFFALLVAAVALAMFMPLIALIQSVSGGGHGRWRL